MRILIGTPAGGGMVTTQYLMSLVETIFNSKRQQAGLEIAMYTLANESLLPRGRNHIAQVALTQKWDKLFFIDADAGWTFDKFAKIAMSPYPINSGICPLKTYPISLNYLPFQEDEKYFNNARRTHESTKKLWAAHGSPSIPVAFVGTAFMCIDTQVLMKLTETVDSYRYPNPHSGEMEQHWDFFGASAVAGEYYSEDWGFCHRAREAGYDIRIDAEVIITHTGTRTYRVEDELCWHPPVPPTDSLKDVRGGQLSTYSKDGKVNDSDVTTNP